MRSRGCIDVRAARRTFAGVALKETCSRTMASAVSRFGSSQTTVISREQRMSVLTVERGGMDTSREPLGSITSAEAPLKSSHVTSSGLACFEVQSMKTRP